MKKFYNKQGKVCGYWIDGIYRKKVEPKKHLLKLMDAYGIDEEIIKQLEGQTTEIRIMELNTGRILSIRFEDFIKHGVLRNFETQQRFVSRKYFHKTKD